MKKITRCPFKALKNKTCSSFAFWNPLCTSQHYFLHLLLLVNLIFSSVCICVNISFFPRSNLWICATPWWYFYKVTCWWLLVIVCFWIHLDGWSQEDVKTEGRDLREMLFEFFNPSIILWRNSFVCLFSLRAYGTAICK